MIDFESYVTDIPNFPIDGVTFKDIQPLLSSPKAFRHAIREMFSKFETIMDYWVGIDSRGFIFASGLSQFSNKGLKLLRKKGKLPPPTVAKTYELEYGSDTLEIQPGTGKVVIVDDVYATGGTMDAAEQLCKDAGYDVIGKVVFIDLDFLHGPTDVKSVIKYEA
jgi:adenine phosphoribosyltransferase|tara:strand:+ start:316 stop:807 length:492 start_codon:yes stop_codon:yes gene_type:complete